MTPLQRRFVLFLVGCMGTRGLFVYLAATLPSQWLKAMAVPALIIATGFTVIFVGGYRRTGLETGGDRIWWNMLRPVHALLYALFAYFAWNGRRAIAWKLLLLDVTIGLVSFLFFHSRRYTLAHAAVGVDTQVIRQKFSRRNE